MDYKKLARYLHSKICVGFRNGYCAPGSDHERRQLVPTAKKMLAADNPAAELHVWLCPHAMVDWHPYMQPPFWARSDHMESSCPVNEDHLLKCKEILAENT